MRGQHIALPQAVIDQRPHIAHQIAGERVYAFHLLRGRPQWRHERIGSPGPLLQGTPVRRRPLCLDQRVGIGIGGGGLITPPLLHGQFQQSEALVNIVRQLAHVDPTRAVHAAAAADGDTLDRRCADHPRRRRACRHRGPAARRIHLSFQLQTRIVNGHRPAVGGGARRPRGRPSGCTWRCARHTRQTTAEVHRALHAQPSAHARMRWRQVAVYRVTRCHFEWHGELALLIVEPHHIAA